MSVRSICGVILVSDEPERLAEFYAGALGIRFEREEHDDLETHFGADIGEVHFGIHPPANFKRAAPGDASTVVAFNVASLDETRSRLSALGAEQVQEPHDEGFGPVASYLDPDGNQFEIVELRYEFSGADR